MSELRAKAIAEANLGTKWHFIHKRVRSPLYQDFLINGISLHRNKDISFPYEVSCMQINGSIALPQLDFDHLSRLMREGFDSDNDFLLKFIRMAYAMNKKMERFARKLEKKDYDRLGPSELSSLWNAYKEDIYRFGVFVCLPIYIESYLEAELKKETARVFGAEANEAFQVLTTPMKQGVIQKQEEEIIRMAIKKKRDRDISRDLEKHVREYSWIKNNKFDGSFYSKAEIEERVNKHLESDPSVTLKNFLDKIKNTNKKFKLYRKALKKNKRTLAIVDTLQESIFFRSWRTERYYRNAFFLTPFFTKIAEMLNLNDRRDVFFLTDEEIGNYLKNRSAVDRQKIEERKNGYVIWSDKKEVLIFSGKEAKFFDALNLEGYHDAADIKGQTAFPGRASGKAKIIRSIKDLSKVEEGDILISLSTTPDYVPVLKKVRAIVTEEGGVLSHASVISRELHIPCIIGTKVATKVLKNGDLVEVDAEKGVVKIIK